MAYLQAPDTTAAQTMRSGLQATMQMSPPPMVALVTYWIRKWYRRRDHRGHTQRSKGTTATGEPHPQRASLSHRVPPAITLAGATAILDRMDLLSHLPRHGCAVVGEDAFAVIDKPPRGIRVSLGAARNRADDQPGPAGALRRSDEIVGHGDADRLEAPSPRQDAHPAFATR